MNRIYILIPLNQLYDFELTETEMNRINGLDRNEKHDWY